jgi:hypothetical protein
LFNQYFLKAHLDITDKLNEQYVNLFDDFFAGDLCNQTSVIKFDLIPFPCSSY